MARTDAGAGFCATLVAAGRAVATARGLINDPFAVPLVHAVGVEPFTRVADGELDLARLGADIGFTRMAGLFGARTRFFDDFFAAAGRAGVRQAVILASGLDARPYRLWWPVNTTLYEIDQPPVIEFKAAAMRTLGAAPSVNHRAVGIDLRHDWAAALRRVGFDAAVPTAWIAEGLLIGFLSTDAQDRLLNNVTELSATGSWLAVDHAARPSGPQAMHLHTLAERWRQHGLYVDTTSLADSGERNDVARYLAARGWVTSASGIAELFAAARLAELSTADLDGAPAAIGYLTARRE